MSALPVIVNLSAYRGDTWSQSFRFLFGTHSIDLAGCTVEAEARGSDGAHYTLGIETTIEDDGGWLITLRMPELWLQPDAYAYDVEVTNADNTHLTWVRGRLIVEEDVTNVLP